MEFSVVFLSNFVNFLLKNKIRPKLRGQYIKNVSPFNGNRPVLNFIAKRDIKFMLIAKIYNICIYISTNKIKLGLHFLNDPITLWQYSLFFWRNAINS